MCGIVGYTGPREAGPLLIEGLKRLEYRGYDSAGIATLSNGGFTIHRSPGKLGNLVEKLNGAPAVGATGIGHTRWATHGRPTELNAHPQTDCTGQIVVVHNGIFENFAERKAALAKAGHRFHSETDTEVFAHEVEDAFQGDLDAAVRAAVAQAHGRLRGARLLEPRAGRPRGRPLGPADRARPGRRRELRRLGPRGARSVDARRHLPRGRRRGARRCEGRGDPQRGGRAPRTAGPPDPVGRGGRGEGRLPPLHGQGDPRAADGDRRDAGREGVARDGGAVSRLAASDARKGAGLRSRAAARLRHVLALGPRREVSDRGHGPDPGRGRLRQRVPLPAPGRRLADADDRHLAVRRDRRHRRGARRSAALPLAHRGDRERARQPDRPHGRRGLRHARGTGDRRGLDQGLHDAARGPVPAGGEAPGLAGSRAGALARGDGAPSRTCPRPSATRSRSSRRSRSSPAATSTPGTFSSWAAASTIRWRSKGP